MKRNPAIELYRIFLMFSIVWLHTLCQGPFRSIPMRSMLAFGVPGFVFISGYFGITFKWRKLFGLYGVAIFASLIAPLVPLIVGDITIGTYWYEVLRVWNPESGFWFLHAYAALMVLSPFLNSAVPLCVTKETTSKFIKQMVPLLALVFIVFGLRNLNHLRAYVPNIPGGQAVVFCAIYMIGRLFSLSKVEDRVPSWMAAIVAFAALAISYFSNGLLNSWFPLLAAMALFVLFNRIRLSECSLFGKVVLMISPCMFGVYCIHGTIRLPMAGMHDFGALNYVSERLSLYFAPPIALLGAALVAFCGALVVEFVRLEGMKFVIPRVRRLRAL